MPKKAKPVSQEVFSSVRIGSLDSLDEDRGSRRRLIRLYFLVFPCSRNCAVYFLPELFSTAGNSRKHALLATSITRTGECLRYCEQGVQGENRNLAVVQEQPDGEMQIIDSFKGCADAVHNCITLTAPLHAQTVPIPVNTLAAPHVRTHALHSAVPHCASVWDFLPFTTHT
jgi:hypothetical protein